MLLWKKVAAEEIESASPYGLTNYIEEGHCCLEEELWGVSSIESIGFDVSADAGSGDN